MPCSVRPLSEQTIDDQQEAGLEAIIIILLFTIQYENKLLLVYHQHNNGWR